MTTTVTVSLVAKLIASPDRTFHCNRRILWRSCFAKTKTRGVSRHDRSRIWKKIACCRRDNPREKSDAKQDSITNRTDKFPPGPCRIPELGRRKEKNSDPVRVTKKRASPLRKMATGGPPFAPMRNSAGQPTENVPSDRAVIPRSEKRVNLRLRNRGQPHTRGLPAAFGGRGFRQPTRDNSQPARDGAVVLRLSIW